MAGSAGFVGRERELSLLRAALRGDARLLLLGVGDAGIGKTRLVGQAVRLAAAEGMLPLWGGCLPLAEKLPLLPVREAAGATAVLPRILPWLGNAVCCRGQVDDGLGLIRQGRALAEAAGDGQALLWAVYSESEILHGLGKFDEAAGVALSGLRGARQTGPTPASRPPPWLSMSPIRC
jgi:predicted ATPase